MLVDRLQHESAAPGIGLFDLLSKIHECENASEGRQATESFPVPNCESDQSVQTEIVFVHDGTAGF